MELKWNRKGTLHATDENSALSRLGPICYYDPICDSGDQGKELEKGDHIRSSLFGNYRSDVLRIDETHNVYVSISSMKA